MTPMPSAVSVYILVATIVGATATLGKALWKLILAINRIADELGVFHWEHKLMWGRFRRANTDLPTYPDLEDDKGERRHPRG